MIVIPSDGSGRLSDSTESFREPANNSSENLNNLPESIHPQNFVDVTTTKGKFLAQVSKGLETLKDLPHRITSALVNCRQFVFGKKIDPKAEQDQLLKDWYKKLDARPPKDAKTSQSYKSIHNEILAKPSMQAKLKELEKLEAKQNEEEAKLLQKEKPPESL